MNAVIHRLLVMGLNGYICIYGIWLGSAEYVIVFWYLWQIETIFSPPRGEVERPVSALGVYKSNRECVLSVTQTYPKLNEIHKKLFEIDHKTSCVQKVPAAPSIFYRESHSKFWMHLSQTMTYLPEPDLYISRWVLHFFHAREHFFQQALLLTDRFSIWIGWF